MKKSIVGLLLILGLTGCATNQQNGALAGAAVGAATGKVLAGNAGAVFGTVLGAAAGSNLGASMDTPKVYQDSSQIQIVTVPQPQVYQNVPPNIVYVRPYYSAPGPNWLWVYSPRYGWSWYHHNHGFYRNRRGW